MIEDLEWVASLTRLKQEDKQRLLNIHRTLFTSIPDPCMNCPDQIRQAVNRIKKYHEKERNK